MASKDGRVLSNRPQRNKVNQCGLDTVPYIDWGADEVGDDLLRMQAHVPRKAVRREKSISGGQVHNESADGTGSGCLICGLDNDHGKLLLCEVCNGEYHTYCLVPPLESIPENEWYCDRCKHIDNLEVMVAVLPESYTSRFGEICWAQGGVGYGWWPACIYDPRLTIGAARIQAIKNLGRKHLVYFFECSEAPFEILPDSKIMPWAQGILEDCHLGKTAKGSSKGRFSDFRCALHAASIEESKTREFRLDWNHEGALALLPTASSSSPIRAGDTDRKQSGKRKAPQTRPLPRAVPREVDREAPRSAGSAVNTGLHLPQMQHRTKKKTPAAPMPLPAHIEAPSSVVPSSVPIDSGQDGEMYCTILLDRGHTKKISVGFVRVQSRKKSTFAQLRRVIESDLIPDAIPQDLKWRFLLPNLGPLGIKQESKFGALLPFLMQTSSSTSLGEGTLQRPVQITLIEAPNTML